MCRVQKLTNMVRTATDLCMQNSCTLFYHNQVHVTPDKSSKMQNIDVPVCHLYIVVFCYVLWEIMLNMCNA